MKSLNIGDNLVSFASDRGADAGDITGEDEIGGGEALQYFDSSDSSGESFGSMNKSEMNQYKYVGVVKYVTAGLIVISIFLIIVRLLRIRFTRKGKASTRELESNNRRRKEEARIRKATSTIRALSDFVEKTPFRLSKVEKDVMTYRLGRANITKPDGKVLKPEEYNAVIHAIKAVLIVASIIIIVLINVSAGAILLILDLTLVNMVASMWIGGKVEERDQEIGENFFRMYSLIHNSLMRNSVNSLGGILKSYGKTTDSEEMKRFVDCCTFNFDVYGEYKGSEMVAKEYREIESVTHLMGIIGQIGEGGDVKQDLIGFREQLIKEEGFRIDAKKDKALRKLAINEAIIGVVFIQAIISAMLIYLGDFTSIGDLI